MQKNIYLWGLPGSGKSFLGERLSAALNRPFIDLDKLIEESEGSSIADIFTYKGEAAFRITESRLLREAVPPGGVVVACGGGTPCFGDNADFMNAKGVTIYLDLPPALIAERLRDNTQGRPLLAGITASALAEKLQQLLESRLYFYQKAHHTISWQPDVSALMDAIIAVCLSEI